MPGRIDIYKEIGKSISSAMQELNLQDSTIIAASSDMTHYEPQEIAEKKDKAAIEAILELNEDKLIHTVNALNISMCGYIPTVIMLTAVKLLGASSARLISYQTSAQASGNYSSVVGYAGIIVN